MEEPATARASGGMEKFGDSEAGATRRRFLKRAVGLMSALAAATLTIPLIGGIIGPSFRRKKAAWAVVGDISSLVVGRPTRMKFPLKEEDAYLRETVTLEVWVTRHAPAEVTVFSPICPHLGCHYNWNPGASEFVCPCHGSVYSIDGKVLGGPAPRPLDTLPWKLEKDVLSVQWEQFKVGIPEKVSI